MGYYQPSLSKHLSFGDFDPDGNDQGKHGSRRGSMLTVAPVDVTNVRLDVKQRLETGNYRKHRVIRRVNVNKLSNEEREQQMKQIKHCKKNSGKRSNQETIPILILMMKISIIKKVEELLVWLGVDQV